MVRLKTTDTQRWYFTNADRTKQLSRLNLHYYNPGFPKVCSANQVYEIGSSGPPTAIQTCFEEHLELSSAPRSVKVWKPLDNLLIPSSFFQAKHKQQQQPKRPSSVGEVDRKRSDGGEGKFSFRRKRRSDGVLDYYDDEYNR